MATSKCIPIEKYFKFIYTTLNSIIKKHNAHIHSSLAIVENP